MPIQNTLKLAYYSQWPSMTPIQEKSNAICLSSRSQEVQYFDISKKDTRRDQQSVFDRIFTVLCVANRDEIN